MVLLVGAGLMLRTLANLNAVPLNFNPNNLLTMQVALPQARYPDAAKRVAFFERVVSEVRALPGVESAAFGSTLPFQAAGNTRFFMVEGRPLQRNDIPDALWRVGTADYLRTLGVMPIEGRLIDARDVADAPRAIVVNETLAQRFLSGGPALGRRLRFGLDEPWFTVVGVVPNVLERGYQQDEKPGVYVSTAQAGGNGANLLVRTVGDPLGYAASIQRIIHQVDPDQPTRLVRSMTQFIGLSVGDRRQHTALLVMFGGLAMLIAALGLYGLLAQMVSARMREIGVRMALGATWQSVVGLVMSRGMMLTITGLAAGVAIAASATRAMAALLYGVNASDPLTFASVIALMAIVAASASAIPAIRAARIDPMVVLRDR